MKTHLDALDVFVVMCYNQPTINNNLCGQPKDPL